MDLNTQSGETVKFQGFWWSKVKFRIFHTVIFWEEIIVGMEQGILENLVGVLVNLHRLMRHFNTN